MTRAFVLDGLSQNRPHYVAIHNSDVIGWCDISAVQRPLHAHVGVLGMGVLSEFRRRGVGKALMDATLTKARSIGLTRIELMVREENIRAICLYKKVGFVIEGLKKHSTRINGQYFDDFVMALVLPDA